MSPNNPPPITSIPREQLLLAFKTMITSRLIDEKAITLFKQNKSNFQIGCAGHEAVQIAAAHATQPGFDWAYPYYRDLAFSAAWGVTPREFFLSIMNKDACPSSGGRQMPNHYGNKNLNIVSQSSPTGTQYLQAVGAARALMHYNKPGVVYVSSGEGTTAQGAYHEALNWAARKKLPIIFLVQDNDFAISVHISEQIAGESVAGISSGYEGLDVIEANGLDYVESYQKFSKAVKRAREGQGPSVIIAKVIRLQSHSISDNQNKYRKDEEITADKMRDPISQFSESLDSAGILNKEQQLLKVKDIKEEIDLIAAECEKEADPSPESASTMVYAKSNIDDITEQPELLENSSGEEIFMVDALNHALDEEMSLNSDMVIYGQDVAYGKGGVFSVTNGLTEKYGERRVFNAPLAEASICGTAVGLATLGLKPVVEVQFGDYVWTGMMQLRNELAMLYYRSKGTFSAPAVVRIAVGGYIRGALYHSQNIEATFAHFPGLKVIFPSNATDAKALLKTAIRDDNPIIFLEHKGLYRQPYAKGREGGIDYLCPIGKAKIVRTGKDCTVVTYGALVQKSLEAAKKLQELGKEVEVIDLRTIRPLDMDTVLSSLEKTGRVLVAHEDSKFMGFGAEIAAQIAEKGFEMLDAPLKRVGGAESPVPHAQNLEKMVLPQTENIINALNELIGY